jgi:HD domain
MLVTIVVAVLPVATVWALWALGVITSLWVAAPLVVALALLASLAGGAYWKRRPAAGDVLFSDLLLWGWLRRAWAERRLADTVELLSRVGTEDDAGKLRLLRRLAAALDAKDPYLDGHSRRVARFSALMAHRLSLPHDDAVRVQTAAAVHDVGKLHVPPEILSKPERLTDSEEEAVHRHADEGAAMVACLGDPALSAIVRHHHERFDGSGYPAGLKGEEIPLGARIVAVADTFDAITSARPYRPAGTHKYALDVLAAEAGTQLDPVVVRAFRRDYAGRRGLALWALLMLPMARARRQPVPLGLVLGGLVLIGAAGTAVQIAGNVRSEDSGRPSGAPAVHIAPPAARAQSARHRPAHKRASARSRRQHAAPVVTATARPSAGPTLVAAVSRRPTRTLRPAVAPQRTATPQRAKPAPRRTPRPTTTPLATATPRPIATPRPVTRPPTVTPPPVTRPPIVKPRPSPPPVSTPRPSPPPAPTTLSKGQCKRGGYAAHGYRNQGQCVSATNRL